MYCIGLNESVSIHALARRATLQRLQIWTAEFVSIHALARRATRTVAGIDWTKKFQFTPSRGGRRPQQSERRRPSSFNSRPRAEGDMIAQEALCKAPVSIHALARRATGFAGHNASVRIVSIHALARRATFDFFPASLVRQFQFTPSRGGRLRRRRQPASRFQFQFTPSRGGRHSEFERSLSHGSFNSRPRAEGDGNGAEAVVPLENVSIHALARRATKQVFSAEDLSEVSIHALARRATAERTSVSAAERFQFTPSRGGRRNHAEFLGIMSQFQFTPSRGGRHYSAEPL